MPRRSLEDRVRIVFLYGEHKSVSAVQKNWGDDPPRRETIIETIRRFQNTGNVNPPKRSGPERTVLDVEAMKRVRQSVEEEPELSVRKRARKLELARSSVGRALKELGFRAYRCQIVQELKETDYQKRLDFSTTWIAMDEDLDSFADKILWSDECKFGLDESVNTRNCYYYSQSNPHYTREIPLAQEGIMAWCGISSIGIVGPFFFDSTVTAASYHRMLFQKVMPSARRLFHGDDFWFQQDGAPAHTSNKAKNYLDKKKPGKWIGKRGPIPWPPRSPDLTPPDFFLWGFLKDRVYASSPETVEDLKRAIIDEVHQIPVEMCERVCKSVKKRLREVLQSEGKHLRM